MSPKEPINIVNQSGFPLQIGLAHLIDSTSNEHDWKVLYEEHAWADFYGNNTGFIDLVLEHKFGEHVFIVECKRVRNATWVFLRPNINPGNFARRFKPWISEWGSNYFDPQGWFDLDVVPYSYECSYCTIDGQEGNQRPMLERTAAQTLQSIEGFAREESNHFNFLNTKTRHYYGVVVTTANLKVCLFDSSKISIVDGDINSSDAQFEDVPFLRFRKEMLNPSSILYQGRKEYISNREQSIFVVNSSHFVDFLKKFNFGT